MTSHNLIGELSNHLSPTLAKDLVESFIELRKDCKTATLGRSSGGKFVETVVQVLQYLDSGTYDVKPAVDEYLRNLESRPSALSDDLRVCCSRIARSSYALRNKRSIAHKGQVDPNIYDLNYTYSAAQWMLSEIVRHLTSINMAVAGNIIEFIQIPVSGVVEKFEDRRLVYGTLTIRDELLVLLHSYYPEHTSLTAIHKSMERRSKRGISSALTKLWAAKLIHKEGQNYLLTQEGFKVATEILSNLNQSN